MAENENSGMGEYRENWERNRRDDYMAGRTDWNRKPIKGNSGGGICAIIFLVLTIATAIGSLLVYKLI